MQNRPFCPRPLRFPASWVRNRPFCPRPLRFPASWVRNRPFCPRPRRFPASRVRNRPFCPRPQRFPASRVRNRPFCHGRWISPPHLLLPRHPDRPCAAAPPRLSLLSSHALAKRSSYPLPPSLPTFRSVWYRCLRRDETVAAVSNAFRVWWASRLPCACLRGRRCGTAFVFAAFFRLPCAKPALLPTAVEFSLLPAFRSVWSRCLRRDETAVFPWF